MPKAKAQSGATAIPTTEFELAQLHASAENALSVALYHLRQPAANIPGAARKTVQALAALNRLRVAMPFIAEGGAT